MRPKLQQRQEVQELAELLCQKCGRQKCCLEDHHLIFQGSRLSTIVGEY